ncbi:MAG: hypothetical protein ACLTN0_13475 [Coprococcus phoceensis]
MCKVENKNMGLDCSMIRHVRVPHEQFVAIKNKAECLIVEDKDKGGCVCFERVKNISDEESNEVFDNEKVARVLKKVNREWADWGELSMGKEDILQLFFETINDSLEWGVSSDRYGTYVDGCAAMTEKLLEKVESKNVKNIAL